MFREMRRAKQALSDAETEDILSRNTSGVLAVLGDGGYPYAVPLSYAYGDGKLYFHSAKSGHKITALSENGKASFCVIDRDDVVPETFSTRYGSVIAFGRARIVNDDAVKRRAIGLIADKYGPDNDTAKRREIDSSFEAFCIIEMEIDHITGKTDRRTAEENTKGT